MKRFKILIVAVLLLGFATTAIAQEQPASSFWRRLQTSITALLTDLGSGGSGATAAGETILADGAGGTTWGAPAPAAHAASHDAGAADEIAVEDLATVTGAAGDYLAGAAGGTLEMQPWHNRSPELTVELAGDTLVPVPGTAYYSITGQDSVADDLENITIPAGFPAGGIIHIRSFNAAQPITLLNTGNLAVFGGEVLSQYTYMPLRLDGAQWITALDETIPSLVALGVASDLGTFYGEVRDALAPVPALAAIELTIVDNADMGVVAVGWHPQAVLLGRYGSMSTAAQTPDIAAGVLNFGVVAEGVGAPIHVVLLGDGTWRFEVLEAGVVGLSDGDVVYINSDYYGRLIPVYVQGAAFSTATAPELNLDAGFTFLVADFTGAGASGPFVVAVSTTAQVPQPEISPFTL